MSKATHPHEENTLCPVCGTYNNRSVTVDGVVVNASGEILLIKRALDPYKAYWALPGGFLDWGETTEEAVIREVKEETGLIATAVMLLGVYSDPGRHPEQTVAVSYLVDAPGKPKAGDDAADCKFFSPDKLPDRLAFDHQKIISDYQKSLRKK